jgi:hypothetical protein
MTREEEREAQPQEARKAQGESVLDSHRWGLSLELCRQMPERLCSFWERYAECFKTKTRDTSEYAYHYLSGLLRLETGRNYTNIGRATGISGENIQHFMSNSPWPMRVALEQVQDEIKITPGLERGGMLLLDESADESGEQKAGAGRQHNGRLGKVEMSQVGVLLAYANLIRPDRPVWAWVDGELYLQEFWFTPEMADLRQRLGIPPEQKFETKIEKGWKMIQRVQSRGLPFEAVACDDLYGRSIWLRDKMDAAGISTCAISPALLSCWPLWYNIRQTLCRRSRMANNYRVKVKIDIEECADIRTDGPKKEDVETFESVISAKQAHSIDECEQIVLKTNYGALRDAFACHR